MSNAITLNIEQVHEIAAQIESDNKALQDLLTQSQKTVDGLSSVWTGKASDETRTAYNTFASKYFETYYDLLNQYVKFLRSNVAEQYTTTESSNTRLADAFK